MVPVTFGGAAAVVVGVSDLGVVTLSVVVLQSVTAEVGGARPMVVVVGNSGDVVVDAVRSVEMVCKILSVVTGGVASGPVCGVVLLVVKGAAGVTDAVVAADVGVVTVPVSTGGEGEAVVEAVPGKPSG